MNAKDVIRQVIEFGDMVTRMYVADLTDEELLLRPGRDAITSRGSSGTSSPAPR